MKNSLDRHLFDRVDGLVGKMVTDGTGLSAQQWPPPSQLQVVDHTSRLISVESLNQPAGKQLDQPDKQWIFSAVYKSVTILSRCRHPES